jgi:hypothetical protein
VATFQAIAELGARVERQATTLMRILAVMETATGLQSSLINEGGRLRVDVQLRQAVPQIIVPR